MDVTQHEQPSYTLVCVRPKHIQGHTWQRDLEPRLRVLFLLDSARLLFLLLPALNIGSLLAARSFPSGRYVVWRTNNVFDSRGLPLDLVGHAEKENGGGDQGDEEQKGGQPG